MVNCNGPTDGAVEWIRDQESEFRLDLLRRGHWIRLRPALSLHHWGTFQLADEARDEPKARLQAEMQRRSLPERTFIALAPADVGTAE